MAKRKDWKELLKQQERIDNAQILIYLDYIKKISRGMKILFLCNCGNDYSKNIRMIVENSGLYCKDCTKARWG